MRPALHDTVKRTIHTPQCRAHNPPLARARYHCDGPIGPVFKKQFIKQYFTVFNFLWRAKRMEHTLAQMWSVQMSFAKELRHVPGMQALAQQCYGVHAAMSHFVNQIQYYFMFEVRGRRAHPHPRLHTLAHASVFWTRPLDNLSTTPDAHAPLRMSTIA